MKCSSAWARQAIFRQLPQKQSPQRSAAHSAAKFARANLALKAEESYECLTLLKSIALLSWFTPSLASAAVGEGQGVIVWAGRKKKDTQKDGQGATGTLLLCPDKSNGAKALQKPSPGL